jgi:hypothetical protein
MFDIFKPTLGATCVTPPLVLSKFSCSLASFASALQSLPHPTTWCLHLMSPLRIGDSWLRLLLHLALCSVVTSSKALSPTTLSQSTALFASLLCVTPLHTPYPCPPRARYLFAASFLSPVGV